MPNSTERKAHIHYARVDEFWRKEEKYAYLDEKQHVGNVEWLQLQPDAKGNWLTEGMRAEFESFIPIGDKKVKDQTAKAIFVTFGGGVKTNRDTWAYNFNAIALEDNIKRTIEAYNEQVFKWTRSSHKGTNVDDFVVDPDNRVGWSRDLKLDLIRGNTVEFQRHKIRNSLYRPFTASHLFFDRVLNEEVYICPSIFPTAESENENELISVGGYGRKAFAALLASRIPDLNFYADPAQCFPFYTYNEDGTNRRENITDRALEQFRSHYKDTSITKWDIFHYVYALLHHPLYRERYAANLKRELPRIPFAPDFRAFADVGKRLAEIHVNYEQQPEYPLERIEKPGAQLDWRVERMKLSKDKRSIIYNDFLTLSGIPLEVFDYRLGNRSALDWIIDQYQVSTDKRSGITNDPNRADDPQYIVRLIGQVTAVSVETVKLVRLLKQELLVEASLPLSARQNL
jgi:predicted helicase